LLSSLQESGVTSAYRDILHSTLDILTWQLAVITFTELDVSYYVFSMFIHDISWLVPFMCHYRCGVTLVITLSSKCIEFNLVLLTGQPSKVPICK